MNDRPEISPSPHAADVTRQTFDDLVIARSHDVPVLVDFWAAWCGPCQTLMPLLGRLADDYQGRFFLAKVNTDVEQDLALKYGVRSLPTVKLFRDGAVATEFMGAQPERTIRALLDRYVPRPSDKLLTDAMTRHAAGDTDAAVKALQAALATDPANDRVKLALAKLLFEQGRLDDGEAVLKKLSIQGSAEPESALVLARLEFLRIAAGAPARAELERRVAANPDDLEARYRLSAQQVLAEDYEPALAHLLEIVRRNRGFERDGARKAMLSVFNLLGNNGELVRRYRAQLSLALN